ncbi:MAG: sigma-54-dependent Fis family transcriptional regulator [Clostridia bacterium]|nr:sigma-54-dependent Fis family transcriptional regulator [Clostridia bacterium]
MKRNSCDQKQLWSSRVTNYNYDCYRVRLKKAWELFITEGRVLDEVVRPVIATSWQRCAKLGVDPKSRRLGINVPPDDLAHRLARNASLISAARPYLHSLYALVSGSGFIIFITDQDGVILELLGDPDVLPKYKAMNLVVGAMWSEKASGTNAVGTALVTGIPLQIVGPEHYCALIHQNTCSAAPIFDPADQLIGVINMTARNSLVHPHTLGMVVAAAQAISNELQIRESVRNLTVTSQILSATMESIPVGVLAIDSCGNITHMNQEAGKILSLDPKATLGHPVKRYFNCEPSLLSVLHHNDTISDMEVALDTPRGPIHCTVSARPVFDDRGTGVGVVATLTQIGRVKKLANQIMGTEARFTFESLIGVSKSLRKCIAIAQTAAQTDSTVLLLGESGTGKELFAQAIHNKSNKRGPFVAVNCAGIPRTLVESELFGYERGAFTGAERSGKPGKFELANGGTLFLDEVADLPLEVQPVLLRAIEEKAITRIGGKRAISVDVRIIAATNRDLQAQVRKGAFRADLFYRLNVIVVRIPPLRDRKEDIPALIEHFMAEMAKKFQKNVRGITPSALKKLQQYDWPGNVRELEHMVERAVALTTHEILDEQDFPDLAADRDIPLTSDPVVSASSTRLREVEKEAILEALRVTNFNVRKASHLLGIGKSTLYRRLKQYNL